MTAPATEPKGARSYGGLVRQLALTHPALGRVLGTAQRHRTRLLRERFGGVRLLGVDELLAYLAELEAYWRADELLSPMSFLIARAEGDYETAIEATLSRNVATAADAMRDVMEIEILLRDFTLDPARACEWLDADDTVRIRRFRPAEVRRRVLGAVAASSPISPEIRDYRGHSIVLHPNPRGDRLIPRGHTRRAQMDQDAPFFEMFIHGERLLDAAIQATRKLRRRRKRLRSPRTLRAFRRARRRTIELREIWAAIAATVRAGSTDE